MARVKADPPSYFGDLVTEAIRRGMKKFEMSGRALARHLGKSEPYVRDRLNGKHEFSLADVETFALFIGMNPEDFIAAIDREALDPSLPERSEELRAVSMRELLSGRPDDKPRNIGESVDRVVREASDDVAPNIPIADKRAARLLGIPPETIAVLSYELWGEPFERMVLSTVAADPSAPHVSEITLQLAEELAAFAQRRQTPRTEHKVTSGLTAVSLKALDEAAPADDQHVTGRSNRD